MGIITVDPQGEIVLANHHALYQFGYTREELVGQKVEVLIPFRLRERHVRHREGYQSHEAHQRPMGVGMDLAGVRKDGTEFPVEVSLSTYHHPDGQYSIAFISDITVRKASENALKRLNDELERKVEERTQSLSEALDREKELGELKSRFVSMASHEFRTPLSTILSSAYLVSKYQKEEDQPKRDKHIQRIVASVNNLTDILNDFLSVGKIEEGRIQVRISTFSLSKWMQETIGELEHVLKERQQIRHSHEGDDNLTLDPSLLKHIVQNLVSNASKFSPEGASIGINTSLYTSHFRLSVRDQGIGISAEDHKHLFERFFRGANAINIQGTGLGLHIVCKYTELMGGTIQCDSQLDNGTTFNLSFKTTGK